MKVYAVTGGGGFVGSHIVTTLLQHERELIELRVLDLYWRHKVKAMHVNVVYICCDITRTDKLVALLEGVDVLIHAAACVDVFGAVPDEEVLRANVHGTHSVLAACVCAGVSCLVYTGSMEAVGPNARGDPFVGHEDTPYDSTHRHCYPRSKAEAEAMVLRANGRRVRGGRRLRTCVLRPTGVYGERSTILLRLLQSYLGRGGTVPRTAPEDALHSRVYAGNVAWMHVLAARALQEQHSRVAGQAYFCYDESPCCSYEEFNVRLMGPLGVSLRGRVPHAVLLGLAHLNRGLQRLLRAFGVCFAPLLNPHTLMMARSTFVVITNKAARDMGYEPLYSWRQGARNTTRWLQEEGTK
ncbi:putative 3-beta-hydroxysteroid dehydrogenase-like protein [Equine molluscum contagiosum-like virus]|nr:putative 3-beta-hydroxysteroid dehydrogenase-like protein [Equine molluscum contagiosum-like virus]